LNATDSRDPEFRREPAVIIGVGSLYRSDDAIGLRTAEALAGMKLPNTLVRKEERDGFRMMDAWQDAEDVVIIDAVYSGQPAGTIMRFDQTAIEVHKTALRCSTHGFGLAEAISLSRTLGKLPRRMTIYGIEGCSFAFGTELSEAVDAAGKIVTAKIAEELTLRHDVGCAC
jgi:hydrogenase maturation protease